MLLIVLLMLLLLLLLGVGKHTVVAGWFILFFNGFFFFSISISIINTTIHIASSRIACEIAMWKSRRVCRG